MLVQLHVADLDFVWREVPSERDSICLAKQPEESVGNLHRLGPGSNIWLPLLSRKHWKTFLLEHRAMGGSLAGVPNKIKNSSCVTNFYVWRTASTSKQWHLFDPTEGVGTGLLKTDSVSRCLICTCCWFVIDILFQSRLFAALSSGSLSDRFSVWLSIPFVWPLEKVFPDLNYSFISRLLHMIFLWCLFQKPTPMAWFQWSSSTHRSVGAECISTLVIDYLRCGNPEKNHPCGGTLPFIFPDGKLQMSYMDVRFL